MNMEPDFTVKRSVAQLLEEIKSYRKDGAGLIRRKFEVLCSSPPSMPSGCQLRVMQWNVLAQALCSADDDFVRCCPSTLDWEIRKWKLLQIMLEDNPDVLCLQEVDKFSFFNAALESVGYTGHFYPKPDSPCLYVEGNSGPDGCAIFFRTEKFEFICSDSFVLAPDHPVTNQIIACNILKDRVLNTELCILTTHLKAKAGYEELRKCQAQHLSEYLQKHLSGYPVVICGDMNGTSEEPLYAVMKACKVPLESVYTRLQSNGSEPPYTTWKIRGASPGKERESCKAIDYIWVTKASVDVMALMSIPSGEDIGPDRLPCSHYPSDHLSLVADLMIKTDGGNTQ